MAAVWAQMQAESDRYLGDAQGAATRIGGALFPLGGRPVADAARRGRSPSRAGTLVDALVDAALRWARDALACARAPSPATGSLLAGEPVLTVTDAGERVLQINLRGEALAAAETAGVRALAGLRRADADAVFLLPGTGRRARQRRRRGRGRDAAWERTHRRRRRAACAGATSAAVSAAPRASILPTKLGNWSCARPRFPRARPFRPARCSQRCSPRRWPRLPRRVSPRARGRWTARTYSACACATAWPRSTSPPAFTAPVRSWTRRASAPPSTPSSTRSAALPAWRACASSSRANSVETLSEYIYMRTVLLPNFGAVVAE